MVGVVSFVTKSWQSANFYLDLRKALRDKHLFLRHVLKMTFLYNMAMESQGHFVCFGTSLKMKAQGQSQCNF